MEKMEGEEMNDDKLEARIDTELVPGMYSTSDGCSCDSPSSAIMDIIGGMCGCGDPESVLEYIEKSMRLVASLQDEVWKKTMLYSEWEQQVQNHFANNSGSEYFMWYFLDDKELTEHGGSVPGWLTARGRAVLALIEKWNGK